MQTPAKTSLRAVFVTVLAAVSLGFPAARAADEKPAPTDAKASAGPGQLVATIAVPKGLTQEEVRGDVMHSLLARHWAVLEKTDSSAVGHYSRGENDATVTLKFDTSEVQIYCVGKSLHGGLPTRWTDNLRKDIGVFMNRTMAEKK